MLLNPFIDWVKQFNLVMLGLTSSSFHKFGTANDSKRSAPQSNFTTTGLGPVKWCFVRLSRAH